MSDTVLDSLGKKLTVGIRVRCVGSTVGDPEWNGVVHSISDADGDVNDYGRPIFWPPSVIVHFDNGTEDSFVSSASWTHEEYTCDDLVVN